MSDIMTFEELERENARLRVSEARYRTLFDALDEGLAVVEMIYDGDGEIIDMVFRQVNEAYERQSGIYNVVGRSISDMLPGVEDVWLDRYKQVARTGDPIRVEDYQKDLGRWFDVRFSRVDAVGRFVAIVFKDITERKRAEEALRESEERHTFLLRLSDALGPVEPPDGIMHMATELLLDRLAANRCAYYEIEDGAYVVRSESAAGVPSFGDRYPVEIFGSAALLPSFVMAFCPV